MANYKEIEGLYKRSLQRIGSSNEEWSRFLNTSARMNRYPFANQVLIYAQRPEATAVAKYEFWNKRMRRPIRRGSKGIAMLNPKNHTIEYGFDITDTIELRRSEPVATWELHEDMRDDLKRHFSEDYHLSAKSLPEVMDGVVAEHTDDCWRKLKDRIFIVAEKNEIKNSENRLQVSFKAFVKSSALQVVGYRANISMENANHPELKQIADSGLLPIYGTAVHMVSRQVCDEIEGYITLIEEERLRKANEDIEIPMSDEEMEVAYEKDGGFDEIGDVRVEAPRLSEGGETVPVQENGTGRRAAGAFGEDGGGMQGEASFDVEDYREVATGTEEIGHDGMGGIHEHREDGGRAPDIGRDGLHLKETDPQQNTNTEAEENQSPAFFIGENADHISSMLEPVALEIPYYAKHTMMPMDVIDTFLRMGTDSRSHDTAEILLHFAVENDIHRSEEFLKSRYKTGGKGIEINGSHYAAWYDEINYVISQGDTAADWSMNSIRMTWYMVALRTKQLIQAGVYAEQIDIDMAREQVIDLVADSIPLIVRELPEHVRESLPLNTSYYEMTQALQEQLSKKSNVDLWLGHFNRIFKMDEDVIEVPAYTIRNIRRVIERLTMLSKPAVYYEATPDYKFTEPQMFVTEDEIKQYLITRGSGFVDGKYRIYEFMHYDDHTDKEKADFLKNEYGIGGSSNALHGAYDSNEEHDAKGIKLSRNWFKDNEVKVLLKWNEVARRIDTLIADGEYLDEAAILEVERRREERLQAKEEETIVDSTTTETAAVSDEADSISELEIDIIAAHEVVSENTSEPKNEDIDTHEDLSETESDTGNDYDKGDAISVEPADGQLSIFDWNVTKKHVTPMNVATEPEREENLHEGRTNDSQEVESVTDGISENALNEDNSAIEAKEISEDDTQAEHIPEAEYTNYHIPEHEEASVGPKERFQRNIAAVLALRIIEEENRPATDLEKQVLSHYVGWGGLADAFDKNKKSWRSEYEALQEILTPQEYVSARESTLNAHFTDHRIIRGIYDALETIGFTGGSILEPSLGIGNFIGAMPESLSESRITGVELDGLSGRIAKVLYPKANITIGGFEQTDEHDIYDLAIGNVPFGDYKVNDSKFNKLGFSIHNYFFAKALEQVRPSGVVAFITSSYTMDAKTEKVRQYLAERAELIGAIRLPDDAFKENAGAQVVTDILFLKKRESPTVISPEWVGLDINADGYTTKSYFVDHPDMILGTLARHSTAFDSNAMTVRSDGRDLREAIREAAKNFTLRYEKGKSVQAVTAKAEETIPADPNVKNYSFTIVDEELYYRNGSVMIKSDMPQTTKQRAMGMVGLRDTLQELIDLQMSNANETDIEVLQKELNKQYDKYVSNFGRINDSANGRAFSEDSSYCLICSLEEFDEEGNFKRKAAIFNKRTIRPAEVITHVDTPADALIESVRTKAEIDFAFMHKLLGADWSYERMTQELQGAIYKNPDYDYDDTNGWETADEYLSGNVRQKLAKAKIAAETDGRFEINVAALKAVQPEPLEATDIDVRIGSTWIDKEYYQQFMVETFQPSYYVENRLQVQYAAPTGRWFITNKSSVGSYDINATETYGTKRVNAYAIFEQSLNLKDVRVYDTIRVNGKEQRVLNSKETALAQQKQQAIKNAFADWIWNDLDRRNDLVGKYNERFNSFSLRDYDGSYLQFPGMTADITLRDYQKNAIARTLFGGNTLLAHAVGAGKTNQAIASAMESKQLGLCQKTIIVVPNHLIQQWGADFLRLYPTANILVATKKDFQTANRRKFCARIATGEYDAIIIGHSQFERIPISDERQIDIIQSQINDLIEAIEEVKAERGENFTIKQMEKMKRSLQVRLEKLNNNTKKDDVVTFEQLGVDKLIVDESHFYKNRFFYTKMRNVAGLSTAAAQKSEDMFMKCRYLDEITGGKGIIFMTGTPISNSLVEMYTLMMYLMHDRMVELGLSHFDSWASTFGETVTSIELAPEGTGYRARTRFAKFFNLPELMTLFKDFADIKIQKQLNLNLPEAEYQTIVTKPSAIQKEMVKGLSKRAERVHAKQVDPSVDNMLKITSDGRKVGLDQRLMNDMVFDDPDSKVNTCVENVFRIWQECKDEKLTQLLFCDLSTPRNDGEFSVYNDIKQKLMTKGIPEEEIAFIHSANTDNRKAELFANVRAGKVRILLGSTQKMGAGTNCQDKLIAVHHLDCGWKPSDMEQRNGRIIRFGNQNKKVYIYQYVTEGTFDAYLFQTLEKKADFIGQVMTDKSPARSCEDVDSDALNYAEIKALCAGDDRIREKMSLDVDVTRLQELKNSFVSQKHRLEDQIARHFPMEIAKNRELIAGYEKDIQTALDNPLIKDGFVGIELFGRTYTDKEKAGEALQAAREKAVLTEPKKIGHYRGFELELSYQVLLNEYRLNLRGEVSHEIALGRSASGNFTRMDNALEKMPELKQKCEQRLDGFMQQLESAKVEITRPFEQETELQEKLARLAELNAQLNIDGSDDGAVAEDEAIETGDAKEQSTNDRFIEESEDNTVESAPLMESEAKSYTKRLAEMLEKDKTPEPKMQIAERAAFVM